MQEVSRCSAAGNAREGNLALVVRTLEAQIVGKAYTSGQTDDRPVMLAEYDPDDEIYNWVQVIHHVIEYQGRFDIGFVYTPDCSKMLTFYTISEPVALRNHYMAYLNVADGSIESMIQ